MFEKVRVVEINSSRWKNGSGETRELAVYLRFSGYNDFIWRVSIATADPNCRFSEFAGVDRTVVLVEGAGAALYESSTGE